MVQMKGNNEQETCQKLAYFISHMVQMKEENEVKRYDSIRYALYPTWFR